MRCRLSPTADVPSHTSGAARGHSGPCVRNRFGRFPVTRTCYPTFAASKYRWSLYLPRTSRLIRFSALRATRNGKRSDVARRRQTQRLAEPVGHEHAVGEVVE